jgi:multidrug efflux pump
VQFELLLAMALVVMVIFVFLRSVPATSFPAWRCRCRWWAPSA